MTTKALTFTPKGRWKLDLERLKAQLKDGTLEPEDRAFIEAVLPGFCDFAAGKIPSWPPRRPKDAA